MNRKIYIIVALLLLAVVGVYFFGGGDESIFRQLMFPDDTIYGPRFSESSFEKITIGMTTEEVTNLIGPPLRIVEYSGGLFVREYAVNGATRSLESESTHFDSPPAIDKIDWIYSQPGPQYDNYYVRAVIFSGTGEVLKKGGSFYSD